MGEGEGGRRGGGRGGRGGKRVRRRKEGVGVEKKSKKLNLLRILKCNLRIILNSFP
jgi:hypothetical protein